MRLDQLLQFHNDLAQFDPSEPIAVSWNEVNGLVYRQHGKVQAIPYMSNYYFPNPKLELGVLMPTDFKKLMGTIETLLQDPALKSNDLNTSIKKYGFNVYKLFDDLPGPQLVYNIEFCSLTNKWVSKFTLYRYSNYSRILLKSINHENRIRRDKLRKNKQES
jgi:hypothetical protein